MPVTIGEIVVEEVRAPAAQTAPAQGTPKAPAKDPVKAIRKDERRRARLRAC